MISDFGLRSSEFRKQRSGDQALLAVAAVFGGRAHFPAEGLKFLLAQDVHAAPSADEHDALLRRALGQQIHRGHAVAAGHQQGSFAARWRDGEAVPERADDAEFLAGTHPRQRLGALADGLVEDGERVALRPGKC